MYSGKAPVCERSQLLSALGATQSTRRERWWLVPGHSSSLTASSQCTCLSLCHTRLPLMEAGAPAVFSARTKPFLYRVRKKLALHTFTQSVTVHKTH